MIKINVFAFDNSNRIIKSSPSANTASSGNIATCHKLPEYNICRMWIPRPIFANQTLLPIAGFLLLMALVRAVQAMPDAIPPASVVPTLNGLNIAYLIRQDKVKVNLYAVNHEKFPVICDSQYESGPDRKDALEQRVMPGKAIVFSYNYAKKTGSITLQLICIKADTELAATTDLLNSKVPPVKSSVEEHSNTNPVTNPVLEVDLAVPH